MSQAVQRTDQGIWVKVTKNKGGRWKEIIYQAVKEPDSENGSKTAKICAKKKQDRTRFLQLQRRNRDT
jgi:hypothetical protein